MDLKKSTYYLIFVYVIGVMIIPSFFRVGPFTIIDILFMLIVFLFLVSTLINNEFNKLIKNIISFLTSLTGILFMVTFLFMLLSYFYALEKGLSLTETFRFSNYIIIFFICKYYLVSEEYIKNILKVIYLSAFLLSIFGIIQYFTGFLIDPKWVDNGLGALNRINMNFENPNGYGALMVIILFPCIFQILNCKEKFSFKNILNSKIFYIILTVLIILNIIFVQSRNAYLAIIFASLIVILIENKKLIIPFIVATLLLFQVPLVKKRITDIFDMNQNESRIKHYILALKMIKDHLFFGVGNGNYVSYYDIYVERYKELDFEGVRRFPSHNSYLKVISELGIIGSICFIFLLLRVPYVIYKSYNKFKDSYNLYFVKGFLASSIAFLFMNMFDNLLFVPKLAFLFWILYSLCEGEGKLRND